MAVRSAAPLVWKACISVNEPAPSWPAKTTVENLSSGGGDKEHAHDVVAVVYGETHALTPTSFDTHWPWMNATYMPVTLTANWLLALAQP